MISQPGFYELTAAEYHADPCETPSLSSSLAATIITQSPAHARLKHPRLTSIKRAEEETEAMGFGSVVHELALGKGGGFAIYEGETWRSNDAKALREHAKAGGKTPIKRADFDRAEKLMVSVRAQLKSFGLEYILDEGKSEQVAIWRNGEHCLRAMFDNWIQERNLIVDIKITSKSAHPEQISRAIANMNYDLRSEFYLMGAEKLIGIPARKGGLGYIFLFVETEPPFSVVPCFLDDAYRARGKRRAQEAIDTWCRCMDSGEWPGYVNGPVEIAAPGWVDYELDDSEITTSSGIKIA